jgi:outer membrane biosynthesis protein TonB
MRTGLTISCAGHAAVLLWSVLTLVVRPYHADSTQALPIDLISTTEFSQMTNGAKNAPQAEHPKPVVDKVAEAAPADDPTAKLANKEVKAATDVPPTPEPKPPEPKAKKSPQPPAPTDPIAEALKKDEDKKPDPKKPDPNAWRPPVASSTARSRLATRRARRGNCRRPRSGRCAHGCSNCGARPPVPRIRRN